MHDITWHAVLALFNLGGGEIILILATVLILFGAKKLPELAQGLGRGITEFRKSTRDTTDDINQAAGEAGRSVGGIYGKRAFQALTPDNQVVELYNPQVPQKEPGQRARALKWIMQWLCRWVGARK